MTSEYLYLLSTHYAWNCQWCWCCWQGHLQVLIFLANNVEDGTTFVKASYKIWLYLNVRRPSVHIFLIYFPGRIVRKLCGCLRKTSSFSHRGESKLVGRRTLKNTLGSFKAMVNYNSKEGYNQIVGTLMFKAKRDSVVPWVGISGLLSQEKFSNCIGYRSKIYLEQASGNSRWLG